MPVQSKRLLAAPAKRVPLLPDHATGYADSLNSPQIPAQGGVYVLWSLKPSDEYALYVGQTGCLKERISGHPQKKYASGCSWTVVWDKKDRTNLEARLFFELEARGFCTPPHDSDWTISETKLIKEWGIRRLEIYEAVACGLITLATVSSPYPYFIRHQAAQLWRPEE